ncbi:UDP-N-acetylmuramoyl-L-alanyl-D-glutamate--2,6-diaminopimelate ligase [Myroides marinus]|uniref:UDP-N-acetylmuramoyl-L-alanyl-D-glutamate--2,6-diaminopimelate ligase n=1 Tax=Myroides marinus TaxID=703342 RepID=A0A1H6RDD5_9FLAO|nr:UDP-N-acetylmuramoyl-L-alanyl-D-glutamate--2,6-diaminopimelate ligase [Myroides marinus]MDM1378143.1 UDP-N-acetylmuramoyl-L-alanyl-D-glutamate--2,6-diaminopimelate ligase [Myroides marinus]MDM1385471.1 UDP-N-acetylmuramoyl-L-alanyl-D-glutamate--2,6-diaminopimelate ligase [Myroides marinus]MDM1392684.1 UDP-N-acetylmuramoyl-L-alanyl-D-glutamate--2,6-diaminopimelate ligase [Myroides marinus]MDM1504033.1 UDP-N-acetylmuramoyl-L-alanyl-D-glutamate--2,6-diaminopimelate ligase [Myroides marinus]SEI
MKKLNELLQSAKMISVVGGDLDLAIDKIAFDSREVSENTLFVAIPGTVVNGHDYISQAIKDGATAVICEQMPEELVKGVTYVLVEDSNKALAIAASNYYDNPSSKLKLVGVTGTNGKTTIATLLYTMFRNLGYEAGLLSTVIIKVGDIAYNATHTTPDSLTINHYLNEMVEAGCEYCFMEVSSHGIVQMRTHSLEFDGGIFTNLTHDHLDYHKTFAEYRNAKKMFFDQLGNKAFAVTNADDKNGLIMTQNTKALIKTYALKNVADFKGEVLESQFSGMLMKINQREIWVQLIGAFNASNLLAVYGAAVQLGVDEEQALLEVSKLTSVAGRFQYVVSSKKVTAIVDYAHTPDALKNVIDTINSIRTFNEKLITVVGCGGNRDKTKRPEMAQIASELSNKVIFTSDNPRFEDPNVILEEMERGVEPQNTMKTVVVEDRKQAIKLACQQAEAGDIILIAGKGHETYQEIKGVRNHFNDLEIVTEFLEQ